MKHKSKTILVTGATGRQGSAVVRHLLSNNVSIKTLSRTPDSIPAQRLLQNGVTVEKGDMADPTSLVKAMEGCDGVFSVQNYFECGGENEIQYGKNMVDAALKSNISHFIYNSVCGADTHTNVPHFETKYIIEQYIKGSALPATILRPVKFMENYYIPQVFRGILGGKLFDAIQSGKRHQMIAADDIGKYVADAFIHPDNYLNKTIEIAGDEMTNEQVAATMSEVLGINVKFKRLPLVIVKLVMDNEMYRMFKWFNEKGFTADLEKVKREFPSVKVATLKEFLVNENWQRWNKKGSV
jgi:uncharacterized protein YbjT (DUF2867 family)